MYNFDKPINRRGTNSVKWDIFKEDDIIPLWVADMDFEVAPAINKAIQKRMEHPVYGYTLVPDSYYDAITSWFHRRHQWDIKKDWIIYTSGVVPAVSATIRAIALTGEKVLIQSPAYNHFFTSILNQGCQVVESPLVRDGDTYKIDFDDFEKKASDEKVTVFVLCNPHNPAGRVWTKDELQRMYDICKKHHVTVVSDEIHCELVMPGYHFTPMASISDEIQDNVVVLNSPSKNFNIAGLQIANIICKNVDLRRRINRVINNFELCDVNPFGVLALQAAYNESEDWLDELNQYLWGNYQYMKERLAKELPQVKPLKLEGTYLAWLDIKDLGMKSEDVSDKLLKEGHVYINSGTMYGKETGEGYLRINLACARKTLEEGINRMVKVLK